MMNRGLLAILQIAILVVILLPGCTGKQIAGGGGAHPTIRIDTRVVDQVLAVDQLNEWLIRQGFESDDTPWEELIGEPATNSTGEVANPETYIRRDSSTASLIAWGIARPTDACRFVDVFHFTQIEAKGDRFETLVTMSEAEMKQFRDFINAMIQTETVEEDSAR